ncbi:MAG TPA: hypothetical protein VLB68_20135 [Pyrinomonadaceae bacterium]|nr:hypothetical protein [Pyrinomonadaceae bacterium]
MSQASTAIDDAVTQVLRGTSGLIDHYSVFSNWSSFEQTSKPAVRFLTGYFTTAEVWITDADLSKAELETGDFSTNSIQANK